MANPDPSPTPGAQRRTAAGGHGLPEFSPLYRQIKALMLGSLQQGEWRPGEAIPSEMELAARYQVSQGTVRKAVDELAADNLVIRRQGRGTFVATHTGPQSQYRFLRLRARDPQVDSETADRDFVECQPETATPELARSLQLAPGAALLHARRLLSFGGMPTILEDLWLPAGPFQGLSTERLRRFRGSTYALFESEFAVHMVRADEKITAVLPDAREAALLGVEKTTPLLCVERLAFTYNDQPMEVRRGLYRTERHYYQNQLN